MVDGMTEFLGQSARDIRGVELAESVAGDEKRRAPARTFGSERGNGERLVEPVGLDDGKLQRSIAHRSAKALHTGKPGCVGLRFAAAKQGKQRLVTGGHQELAHG